MTNIGRRKVSHGNAAMKARESTGCGASPNERSRKRVLLCLTRAGQRRGAEIPENGGHAAKYTGITSIKKSKEKKQHQKPKLGPYVPACEKKFTASFLPIKVKKHQKGKRTGRKASHPGGMFEKNNSEKGKRRSHKRQRTARGKCTFSIKRAVNVKTGDGGGGGAKTKK